MQLQLWAGHQTAAFMRCDPTKPLPEIGPLLKKIAGPQKNMSAKAIRNVIINLAKGLGAEIIYVPKEEFR